MRKRQQTLASFGSGEFAVLLRRRADLQDYQRLVQSLQASMDVHFTWQQQSVQLSCQIGGAKAPVDGDHPELLLKHAKAALYSVQLTGRSGFQLFDKVLFTSSLDALKLETELARALEQQEFVLFYQPKYSLVENGLCGAEALIRWRHPVQGLVGPLRFIHLLESTDLIVPVGRWCIKQAVEQLARWQQQGLENFVVAVNVSLKQLQPGLVDYVAASLEQYSVQATCLELELTESIMHEPGGATDIVKGLRALGVRIAVDDFGTGYSTLGCLKSFVPDTVKIEKSFLDDMISDTADQAIVRGVIEMAHALNMTVVAEGVEYAEQKQMLERLNCDQIQGYLLSPPIEPSSFAVRFLQGRISPVCSDS